MKQLPLAIGPQPRPSFDSYLSPANADVVRQLRGLRMPAPPAYLWGPSGSGKSHLLHALLHERESAAERASLFDALDERAWLLPEGCSLVIVDRCESLDAQRQQDAFRLFVQAGEAGVQWVAAGRLPPVDLPLREDLRTRLAWGHVFALQPLGEAETCIVLRREAERRGIFLGDEVMHYLLTRFERDLTNLMALLDRLDVYALSRQRGVTVPLLRQMLLDSDVGAAA